MEGVQAWNMMHAPARARPKEHGVGISQEPLDFEQEKRAGLELTRTRRVPPTTEFGFDQPSWPSPAAR